MTTPKEIWGYETLIDLSNCNPLYIRDKDFIEKYVIQLCVLIDMKRYGDCQVVYFGEHDPKVSGYSMTQLIETSLISGHFRDSTNSACINIFSCRPYNSEAAINFTKSVFEAKSVKSNYILRE